MIPSLKPREYRYRRHLRYATCVVAFGIALSAASDSHGANAEADSVHAVGEARTARTTTILTKKSPSKKSRAPVIAMRPAASDALATGYAALLKGDYLAAESAYRQALQHPADERDAWLGLASIAHHQGRLDAAWEGYRRVLRHDPQNLTAQAGLIGLLSTTAPENAAALARELAEHHPQSATAQAVLGDALARTERLAEARQAFLAASTLAPDDGIHAYNLAVALDRLHRPAQAASHYERAIFLAGQSGMGDAGGAVHRSLLDIARQRLAQLRPRTAAAEASAQPLHQPQPQP